MLKLSNPEKQTAWIMDMSGRPVPHKDTKPKQAYATESYMFKIPCGDNVIFQEGPQWPERTIKSQDCNTIIDTLLFDYTNLLCWA